MNNWKLNQLGFVEVDVTPSMIASAEARNKEFYARCGNVGTHRKDKSRQRVTGYLAEMAVKLVYPRLEFSADPTVDFVFNGITFDVKAQGCNGAPGLEFAGTLYEEQAERHVDFYIFTRVKNDSSKVWITGFVSKPNFFMKASLIPAGTANNNFVYDQSRYEIKYSQLTKPQSFMSKKS
jgi:hypothetical protein